MVGAGLCHSRRDIIPDSGARQEARQHPSEPGWSLCFLRYNTEIVTAPHVAHPREGERIGPYHLESPIGSGGMGTVWRAWDERLRRHVAVKQVLRGKVAQGRERLRREARAAARLSHPAIVHVYDFLEGDDADWIVMELVRGETLRQRLDREGRLAVGRALELGREIAGGLAEAHAQGILHRDLKAANIMVTASGHARILDFGLAKRLQEDGHETAGFDQTLSIPGMVLGTCFAMSPEQVLGSDLDARSDLFSLGSLLYEALTGNSPFCAEDAQATLSRGALLSISTARAGQSGLLRGGSGRSPRFWRSSVPWPSAVPWCW